MRYSSELWTVVTMLDSRNDSILKDAAADGKSVTTYKEDLSVARQPAPDPQRSRRDGYLTAGMIFFCAMTLAAIVAVLYAPLPRAQLVVPLAASVFATLTAVLAWRRSG